MEQERTGGLLLDKRLLDSRLVGIVLGVQRIPYIQIGISDDYVRFLGNPVRMGSAVQRNGRVDIGAGLDSKINTDKLTAEREREPLCVRMESIPAVTESETALAGIETEIDGRSSAVE